MNGLAGETATKRIAICDDNEIQREILEEMLKVYFRRIHAKAEILQYQSGEMLIADVEEELGDVELIFLDIYMQHLNGIETARKLRQLQCNAEIVFLTGTAEYAVESYDVRAAGYLLKPVDMDKLLPILEHIFWRNAQRRIEVKSGRQYRYPYVAEIMYIESYGHAATLHMANGTTINTLGKLSEMLTRIDDDRFLQCHQSYLVNMDYIADIQKEILLRDATRIPVSARRKKEVRDTYHVYFQRFFS